MIGHLRTGKELLEGDGRKHMAWWALICFIYGTYKATIMKISSHRSIPAIYQQLHDRDDLETIYPHELDSTKLKFRLM